MPKREVQTPAVKVDDSHDFSTGIQKRKQSEQKYHAVTRAQLKTFEWKKCEFDQLMTRHMFLDSADFFMKWDFEKIANTRFQWQDKLKWISIYIIANNHHLLNKQASIGRVSFNGLEKRFHQHNGTQTPLACNRKLFGHCKLVFFMILPPFRNFTSQEIIVYCRVGRGWSSRCQRAIQMAHSKALPFYVSRDVFTKQSDFYSEQICQQIQSVCGTVRISNGEIFVENHIKALA